MTVTPFLYKCFLCSRIKQSKHRSIARYSCKQLPVHTCSHLRSVALRVKASISTLRLWNLLGSIPTYSITGGPNSKRTHTTPPANGNFWPLAAPLGNRTTPHRSQLIAQ